MINLKGLSGCVAVLSSEFPTFHLSIPQLRVFPLVTDTLEHSHTYISRGLKIDIIHIP